MGNLGLEGKQLASLLAAEPGETWRHETVERLARHYETTKARIAELETALQAEKEHTAKLHRHTATLRGLLEEMDERLGWLADVCKDVNRHYTFLEKDEKAKLFTEHRSLFAELSHEVQEIMRDGVRCALDVLPPESGPSPGPSRKPKWRSRRRKKWRNWLDARFATGQSK